MSEIKINDRILKGIRENSRGDDVIEGFLFELIYEEVEHASTWWWKDFYKKQVDKYSTIWEENNEN